MKTAIINIRNMYECSYIQELFLYFDNKLAYM
jgi:hypothetical protein